MNWFKQLLTKIAKKIGLSIQDKPIQVDDYSKVDTISWTATIANRLATLTMLDSGINVEGDNKRGAYIDHFTQDYVDDRMAVASEVSLGTGDCLIKPYTDGVRIGVDIIENERFRVCESIGNFIKSCVILADHIKDNMGTEFVRIETQRLQTIQNTSILFIYQNAYKNNIEVPLSSVETWAGIKPEEYIPNVDRMLFGRYKCPTVNRSDINGVNGVKVTFGLDEVMQKAVEAYNRFNTEYEIKESFIFADKSLFKAEKKKITALDGSTSTVEKPVFAAGKDRIFMQVEGGNNVDSQKLLHEYSPDIRNESFEMGLEVNLKMLELLAGLSNGVLTKPVTNYATATEMKASLQNTFAFITKFRKSLEKGTNDLLYAVDILCNVNNITPPGEWLAKFDWSDGYVENMQDRFNQLMQSESIGAVEKAEVRAWTMNEDLEIAQKRILEIAEKEPEISLEMEV